MIGKNRYFPKTIENDWNYTSFESSRQAYFDNWRIIDLARSIPEISMKKAISSIRLLRVFVSHIFHKDASNEIFFWDILNDISIVYKIIHIYHDRLMRYRYFHRHSHIDGFFNVIIIFQIFCMYIILMVYNYFCIYWLYRSSALTSHR